jgi:hypothetical protein
VNTTVLVVAIVVGILIVQVLVWIPIVWFRRRSRVVAGGLATEIEGETVVRAPEKGVYRGATAPGYPVVKSSGLIALTRRQVVFRTPTGKAIDVPDNASWIASLSTVARCRHQQLVVESADGEPVVSRGPRRSPWLIQAIMFASIGLAFALAAGISAAWASRFRETGTPTAPS